MHQNTFGSRAPPGPAVRAYVLPHADPLAAMEDLLLRGWKGRKGRGLLKGDGREWKREY